MAAAPIKLDKDFGAWEKHTKGVGLKLLQKFGFKGRLGANETGITTAIETIARPAGVGLGFGSTGKGGENGSSSVSRKRPPPASETEKIASLNTWKRKEKKDRKTALDKTVSELISARDAATGAGEAGKAAGMTIIDMRSEVVRNINAEDISAEDTAGVKFGEELLYNLDKMNREIALDISVRRNKLLHEHSARERAGQRSVEEIERLMELDVARVEALGAAVACLGRVSSLEEALVADDGQGQGHAGTLMTLVREVTDLVVVYPQTSAAQDLPRVYADLFRKYLARRVRSEWQHPLENPNFLTTICKPWFLVVSKVLSDDGSRASLADVGGHNYDYLINRAAGLLENHLQVAVEAVVSGCVSRALVSDWAAARDMPAYRCGSGAAVVLVEGLEGLVGAAVYRDLCISVVLPKLTRAVATLGEHHPGGASSSVQMVQAAQWLQPWVRVFNSPVLLEEDPSATLPEASGHWMGTVGGAAMGKNKVTELFPEVRRKLRHFIGRMSVDRDAALIQAALQPWCSPEPPAELTNFDLGSYLALVGGALVPKLAQMVRAGLDISVPDQDLQLIECLLGYWAPPVATAGQEAGAGVLPTAALVQILEGELFPKWLHVLVCRATETVEAAAREGARDLAALRQLAQWYTGWRVVLPEPLLDQCPGLLRYFSVALAVLGGAADALEMGAVELKLPRLVRDMSNYRALSHTAVARRDEVGGPRRSWTGADRFSVNAPATAATPSRAAAAAPLGAHLSFRDSLELLVRKHDLSFLPRVPHRFHESGKQLYVLGADGRGVSCFIDNDVLFAMQPPVLGSLTAPPVWTPVSVDEAVSMAVAAKH